MSETPRPGLAGDRNDATAELVASPTALRRLLRQQGALPAPARGSRRGNKYGARRTEYGGQVYESRVEAQRAAYHDLRLQAGAIRAWQRGGRYVLTPGAPRACHVTWRPDFEVTPLDRDACPLIVEDVKGGQATVTPLWRVKAKLFRWLFPAVRLVVVRLVDGAWQEEVWIP